MKVEARHKHPGYHNAAGVRLPSVTTIAKLIDNPAGLIRWAYNCGRDGLDMDAIREDASSAGHIAHGMIEAAIKGGSFVPGENVDPEVLQNAKRSFAAFTSWLATSQFQLERTEVALVSERHQFGGRLDCVASIMGERSILDWKTSKSVYSSYLVQVAAYRGAWNENNMGQPILGCHLLRLKKDDAGFVHHYFPPETLDQAWRGFLICRELYEVQKELDKLI